MFPFCSCIFPLFSVRFYHIIVIKMIIITMGNQLDELYRYFGKLPYLYVCLYHVFVTAHKI